MSEFNGTEGKWKVIEGKSSGKQVISESAPKIRMNVASCGGQRRDENANLIAAAPELLEALQLVMSEQSGGSKSCGHNGFTCTCPYDKAKAAISKALGQ